MKRKIIFIGITLWLIAFIQLLENGVQPKEEMETMTAAFAENDFLTTMSAVTASGTCSPDLTEESDQKDYLYNLAGQLGMKSGLSYDYAMSSADSAPVSTLVFTGTNCTAEFNLTSVKHILPDEMTHYKNLINVTITFHNSPESAFYYRDLLKSALEARGVSADLSIELRGTVSGELSMREKNLIADRLIKSAGGEILTENRTDRLFTVFAYTDLIDDYILSGSLKTNLNVAISYNEVQDLTTVYMATPLLNTDY